jgi:hypothetical protein
MGPGTSHRRLAACALGLVLALCAGVAAAAEPMPLRPDLQVPLLLKILTYDRHFEQKAGRELSIGISYAPEDPESKAAAEQILQTLYRFRDKTVKTLPIRYHLLEYTGADKLQRSISERGVSVLYVAPGMSRHLEGLVTVSQGRDITTVTGVPDYVRRGISVGIGLADDRPQIVINQTSARAEGSEFDASLLRIATVVK